MEKFKLNSHNAYNNLVNWLCEQKEFERFNLICEVKQFRAKRSLSQNRLYHMYKACISQETGQETDSLHEWLLFSFSPKIEINGCMIPKRSKALDTKEFTIFIDRMVVFASSELSITLPDPEDKAFEKFVAHYENYI